MSKLKDILSKTSQAKEQVNLEIEERRNILIAIKEREALEKRAFIGEALDNFLKDMESRGNRSRYISGGYTSDFTKFVNRNHLYNGLSFEHRQAINAFTEAKEELNRQFLEAVKTPEARDKLIHGAGIKNI